MTQKRITKTLWGLTSFFNPTNARSRVENYQRFRQASSAQGLPLVAVELAFGDVPFQLEQGRDAEILIQKRSTSVLWQKERLLNLGLRALPSECRNVCWADADILFEDDDWLAQAERLLAKRAIIQPFSHCIRLPEGATTQDFPSSEMGKRIPQGNLEGTFSKSTSWRMSGLLRRRFMGATGYVWCARRPLLDQVGFYDRCIVGGGDRELALAAFYRPGQVPEKHIRIHCPRLREDIRGWHARWYRHAPRDFGYRRGVIYHLFHGDTAARRYSDRHQILVDHDFDPNRDVTIDESGCLRFTDGREGLKDAVSDYFRSRQESAS
jgi:hypothetical protein